jgi:hypothetical protein
VCEIGRVFNRDELQSVSPISAMDPSFNRLGRSSIRRI